MATKPKVAPADFEAEVRRIATAMWPGHATGGSEIVGGTQIDGVYRTEDVTHLVECTVERSASKVREDVNKLVQAKRAEERGGNLIRCWMVVLEDPSPEQRVIAREGNVVLLTLEQFRNRLIQGREYVEDREKHPFGSAADPLTGEYRVASLRYHPLPMVDDETGVRLTTEDLILALLRGDVVVLLGDYGTGKSLTVREVFRGLRARFLKSGGAVPVVVNLRQHWAQTDPDEVLRRHAGAVAFPYPNQLVRAWKGGHAVLLLDGFDELAMQPWSNQARAHRSVRHESVTAVRRFLQDRAPGCGVFIVGREQYFNSISELRGALGVPQTARLIRLRDFTAEEAQAFLKSQGAEADLPRWFPTRALTLAYFAKAGLAEEIRRADPEEAPALAWRHMVGRLAEREAQLAVSLDAQTILAVMQRLATLSRRTPQGQGPLLESDLRSAFRAVTGVEAQYDVVTIMLRLPGLAATSREDGGRYFVDDDLLDTLRAADVVQFASDPHNPTVDPGEWHHPLGELGVVVGAMMLRERGVSPKAAVVAARVASRMARGGTLSLDLLCCGQRLAGDGETLDCEGIFVSEGDCALLDLENYPLANVSIDSCIVRTLRLPPVNPVAVHISNCLLGRTEGAARTEALPQWMRNNDCDTFDNVATTTGIMALRLPPSVKVALTILKKVYLQRGSGRKESALFRGLDAEARHFVRPALESLQSEGLIWRRPDHGEPIWHPVRSETSRALAVLSTPTRSSDPLFARLQKLD